MAVPNADPSPAAVTVLDARRSHRAPEGLFQLPRIASGVESFEFTVPNGLRLAVVDLELTEASNLASAEIENRPAHSATGRLTLQVRWSHPVPTGAVAFRLRVHATPDGHPPPILMQMTEPRAERRFRSLVEQDVPVDLAVSGPLAKVFHDQILERGGRIEPLTQPFLTGLEVAALVVVALGLLATICILAGMGAFAAVIFFAMSKGYDIDNAGYTVATGEGDGRQEHEMLFNIRQPGT